MIFGCFPIAELEGAILAHRFEQAGMRLPKGHKLRKDDIEALKALKISALYAAKLGADDIEENDAADLIAAAAQAGPFERRKPMAGRVNLYATQFGFLTINTSLVKALSALDEAIALSTIPNATAVRPGQIIATIKIIPFAIPKVLLDDCISLLKRECLFNLTPFEPQKCALISTTLAHTSQQSLEKNLTMLNRRLIALGLTAINNQSICQHRVEDLDNALQEPINKNADILFLAGASAIVDREDIIPQTILKAGGEIIRFGLPIDPGNLLLLAKRQNQTIIALPGCSKSPLRNGLDLILERVAAKVPITNDMISDMAIGGLMKDDLLRPQKREATSTISQGSAAIILAAGTSSRMGSQNKLTTKINGKPMVRHAVESAIAANVEKVIVVTGHQAADVQNALCDLTVEYIHNPHFGLGMGTSIALAAEHLSQMNTIGRAVILLGDMPFIQHGTIRLVLEALDPESDIIIAAPQFNEKRGHPVAFDARLFTELAQLNGDFGAREILAEYAEFTALVPVSDDTILIDLDTEAAIAKL